MQQSKLVLFIVLLPVIFFVSGCATTKPSTDFRSEAIISPTNSATHKELLALPKPKGKIVVAVYNFRDQTGQYKPHPTASSFSTAITQGATSMLIKALKDSEWFIPVEREGLNNLLTERKIIRAKINGNENDTLPKLMHAPLMLEGGIIAYETNVMTGGLGAKYFGIGASTQYRKDQITLYLRAVDVNSGEILNSVSTSKAIYSMEVDVGVFRFVDFKRLLEVETGFTTNEPPQLCVLNALEKAVTSMIIEGTLNGMWKLENQEDINHPVIKKYMEETGKKIPKSLLSNVSQAAGESTAN